MCSTCNRWQGQDGDCLLVESYRTKLSQNVKQQKWLIILGTLRTAYLG